MKTIALYALAWLLVGCTINYSQAVAFSVPDQFGFLRNPFYQIRNGLILSESCSRSSLRLVRPHGENFVRWYPQPPVVELPNWASVPETNDETQVVIGWPYRSLTGWIVSPAPGAEFFALRDMVQLPPDYGLTFVPLRPIWRGFFLNAMIWGWPVLLIPALRLTVRLLQRLIHFKTSQRLRRGLCPRCAYDLRTGMLPACPECGFGTAGPA